jgi:ABC-type Mn2+/Zn2+ transport system permease subunit
VGWLTEPFAAPFMQRALLEVVLLAAAGGLLGTWVVLRRLAFFTHAVGSATFPGLVVAGPWGIAPPLAALGTGLGFAAALRRSGPPARVGTDARIALLLVGALALGAVLASDVYRSGAGVDRLLFGTLVAVSDADLWLAGAVALLAAAGSAGLGRLWLAGGFDADGARPALGRALPLADLALLAVLVLAVVASLPAVGALLVSALLVVPAATARIVARSLRALVMGALVLAVVEGVVGLWIAWTLDVPPGPATAALGGAVFAGVAVAARGQARVPG